MNTRYMQTIRNAFVAFTLSLPLSTSVMAVTDAEFKTLQDRLNQLADAIEQNKPNQSSTHLGGYGELHYNNTQSSTGPRNRSIDFHRFVLEVSHDFSPDVRLITELELEHALVEDTADGSGPGEVELEQAYVQIDLTESSTFNAGIFLLPVGIINESHEPPRFYGVERNPVEKNIIPATWWEAGAMYSANLGESGLSYDVALHSGLDGGTNIRGGRQKAAKASAQNLAATARIRYSGISGLELAASLQFQDDVTQDNTDNIDGAVLLETHAIWNQGATTIKFLYAQWDISGDGAIATEEDKQKGYYLEGAYKLNSKLGLFARQNAWDNGGTGDTGEQQTDIGVSYWMHEDVVFKFDFQFQNEAAGNKDGFNLGLAYQF